MSNVTSTNTKNKRLMEIIIAVAVILLVVSSYTVFSQFVSADEKEAKSLKFWNFQAIDTMKYSRDLSREKLKDPRFDVVIERQTSQISRSGASHIVIATPYDEEFLPILKRWVRLARKYKLKVWFRGNFSGWEQWFGYKKIDRAKHTELLTRFILQNKDLFEDGDKFSPCPECENGGPGDPRRNGDVTGYRNFMIEEYQKSRVSFEKIGKNVDSNYNSMNGDVAELVMDPETTSKMGGVVVIDHYVKNPARLNADITRYANKSKGKVILGEFGAPIPDIHGKMSEVEQKEWLQETLDLLSTNTDLIGLNYWTATGGSTELWDESGYEKAAAKTLSTFYNPYIISIKTVDVMSRRIPFATLTYNGAPHQSDNKGEYSFPSTSDALQISINATNYESKDIIAKAGNNTILLRSLKPSLIEKLIYFLTHFPLSK